MGLQVTLQKELPPHVNLALIHISILVVTSISKKEHYDNNLLVSNPLTSNITLNWSSNTEELINFELYSSEGKF